MSRPHTHTGTRIPTTGSHNFTRAGQPSPEVVMAVRQLLSVALSHLNSHPQCSCEEALAQLPATDDSFHCYDLVRQLQGLITSHLSPVVAMRLSGLSLEGDGHSSAAQLTDHLLASPEYKQLLQNFSSEVRDAVEEMLTNSAQLSPSSAHNHHSSLLTPSLSQATQYYSLDASLGSDLSFLLNQTSLFSPDQLVAIAEDLVPSAALEVRIEAMHHLLQFPVGDLVAMEIWAQLKPAVSEALMDENSTLAGLSLTLHSRLFSSHTSSTAREAFLSLAQQLCGFFQGREGGVVTMAMGIDPADDRSLALLQRINLLNRFQHEVTSYWLRYNERAVEEMITATFDLLLLGYDTPILLSPIHFLCLVDPLAQWFKMWTHGQFSRRLVLKAMSERPGFLLGTVSHVMSCRMRRHGRTYSKHHTNDSGFYNESSLHHLLLCHSLSVLERLLLCVGGRKLFPVTARGRRVAVSDLLVHLLQLLYSLPADPAPLTSEPSSSTDPVSLDPTHLIVHLFNELVAGNTQCRQLLTHEAVLSTLLYPITSLLDGRGEGLGVAMATLERVGQIVAGLAASNSGRGILLSSPAMHSVAKFMAHCLQTDAPPVTPVVMATWVFVCRQLYKVGAGLVAMETYQLHTHIANLIKKLGVEEVKVQLGGRGFQLGPALLDNLLSVAWSPRGVLLLQLSGVMRECVWHMRQRIRERQQVSWCDRYGYGSLVSQLAATSAGARELINCGLVSDLLSELWEVVEGEGEGRDARLVAPWTHPLDPTDHALHKSLIGILSVLSNFPLLYKLLSSEVSTSETTPTSLDQLLDRLVLIDSAHKQRALLGYPESHLVGLRVVSVVTTSLDSLLLLQQKYGFLDTLLALQREGSMETGEVILDACSVQRNRILVAGYLIGGPVERTLPPHHLSTTDEDYPWSLFTDYPPPPCYYGNITWETDIDKDSTLYKLLSSDPSRDAEGVWLSEVREVYCEEVQRKGTLPNDLVALLLSRCVEIQSHRDTMWPVAEAAGGRQGGASGRQGGASGRQGGATAATQQSQINTLGAEMVVRYGVSLGLLTPPTVSAHIPSLTSLLTRSQSLFTHHNKPHPSQQAHPQPSTTYPGFDWLVGVVFILMRGREDAAWRLLSQLSPLLVSGYIWMSRLHCSSHLSEPVACSGVHPVTYNTCHYVEMILQSEAPQVASAFQLCGCSPSQLTSHWLRQVFLNYLDWPQILLYLATTVVMGTDYQVYYCVSVLKSLQADILLHSQSHHLMVSLREEGLGGFQCGSWLAYMRQLQHTYRDTVLPALRRIEK